MKLLIGTKNRDKIKELMQLLAKLPIQIVTMTDYPDLPDVEEPFETIEENAIAKAKAYAGFTGLPTIADDTGFFVEALQGEPGVKAARYAGEHCSYQDNRLKVLRKMQFLSNRKAYFSTVVAYCKPSGEILTFSGRIEGEITESEIGNNGFGYDSIFYIPELESTFAQMKDDAKNKISHRAIALQKFAIYIKKEV